MIALNSRARKGGKEKEGGERGMEDFEGMRRGMLTTA